LSRAVSDKSHQGHKAHKVAGDKIHTSGYEP
jgi:hypothetical protein